MEIGILVITSYSIHYTKLYEVIRSGEPIDPSEPDNFYVARNADGTSYNFV